jgi:N-acetylmuramoyl-L-alanine amidase
MIVVLLLVTLVLSGSAFANKFLEYNQVEMIDGSTGKVGVYETINMMLYGEDLLSDVPAILYPGNRTLVPVGMIAESLGAEVKWDAKNRQVELLKEGVEVLLTIDSKVAQVNGERRQLPSDVPAKIMVYDGIGRTMVPIAFVTDVFGLESAWIGETKTVALNEPSQAITGFDFLYMTKFPEIRLQATGEIKSNAYTIEGKSVGENTKLVVDLQNTEMDFSGGDYREQLNIFGLESVRVNQVGENPALTRMTFELSQKKGYEIFYDDGTEELVIRFINSVEAVSLEKIYSAETVVIKTTEEMPAYNVDYLGDRIVVDLINATLKAGEGGYTVEQVGSRDIDRYSFSQLDVSSAGGFYEADDVVSRITVDLGEERSPEDVYVEAIGSDVFVYVSGNPLDGFEYVKTDRDASLLTLELGAGADYVFERDDEKNRATLEIPIDRLNLEDMTLNTEDAIVDGIAIEREQDRGVYRLTFALMEGTSVQDHMASNGVLSLGFTNRRITDSKFSDILLVLDAGHGGKDPGASGATLREKDVVLDVTLRLRKKLEAAGFKVYLTRDDDTYVDLYARAHVANELGATGFVSIHANAHGNNGATGVEVLYAPDEARPSYGFSKALQDGMVATLGATDRGVVQRPNLVVLRETQMPAALVEIGFLTNEEDHYLLMQGSYRERVADALYKGIVRHYQ